MWVMTPWICLLVLRFWDMIRWMLVCRMTRRSSRHILMCGIKRMIHACVEIGILRYPYPSSFFIWDFCLNDLCGSVSAYLITYPNIFFQPVSFAFMVFLLEGNGVEACLLGCNLHPYLFVKFKCWYKILEASAGMYCIIWSA